MTPMPEPGGAVYVEVAPMPGMMVAVTERRRDSPGSSTPLGLGTGVLVPAVTSCEASVRSMRSGCAAAVKAASEKAAAAEMRVRVLISCGVGASVERGGARAAGWTVARE